MSDEKKTVELKDEELEKVSGGQMSPNSEGYYVFTRGDIYYQGHGSSCACGDIYILESKTTNNMNDRISCRYKTNINTISESKLDVSFLVTCTFSYHTDFDPSDVIRL